MEVTKWLKPSISVSRIGDSASVQATTRVNVEQASKRKMCRPIRLPYRGRLKQLGELSEEYGQLLHRGIGGGMYTRKDHFDRVALCVAVQGTHGRQRIQRKSDAGWLREKASSGPSEFPAYDSCAVTAPIAASSGSTPGGSHRAAARASSVM
jgi:hypothetical protein